MRTTKKMIKFDVRTCTGRVHKAGGNVSIMCTSKGPHVVSGTGRPTLADISRFSMGNLVVGSLENKVSK